MTPFFLPCRILRTIALASLFITSSCLRAETNYFRSDGGVSRERMPLPDNLENPETLSWRVPLDGGHSSPILNSGRIFVTTWRTSARELATVALDQKTGQELWRNPLKPAKVEDLHQIGSPATATVACDGKRVYSFFGSAGMFCYDLDGRRIWEQPMGPFRDEYGAGSSPIVFEGKILLNQDHDVDSFLVALDCATGKELWKARRPDAVRSYSTPAVWMPDGRPEILVAGSLQLSAYDPAKGERLWWLNGLARIVIPTPVIDGSTIYMASWAPGGDPGKRVNFLTWPAALAKWDTDKDGKLAKSEIDDREVLERFFRMDLDQDGKLDREEWERHAAVFTRAQNAVLALKPAGKGELSETIVRWKHGRGVPYVSSPVLDQGILWLVKDGGIVTKLEVATGLLLQEERLAGVGQYFASPIAADGKVYFASEPGVLTIMAAQKDWRILSSRDFREKIFATPAVSGGNLFIRTEEAMYSFHAAPAH